MNVIISGIGHNLASIYNALSRLGVDAVLTRDPQIIKNATRVILPGVGTANHAMANLRRDGLDRILPQLTMPVLGICVGMQILMTSSQEDATPTLGIIPGIVERLQPTENCRVPNMGWCQLQINDQRTDLFKSIADQSYVYCVHSFALKKCANAIAFSGHSELFVAAVQKDNFIGVQFHPERSDQVGAQILKNFLTF